ncbi:hypothetical protein EDD37DRAFT_657801 [Exophiala viscosa]|uniref:UspA domain-containing protein n=1 Tax=Exophiala viscosa TaxID=2486360 RepID=A0AAN6IEX3_9EURO|nr:hypothetical protein EDD36DRAFT_485291 [Exophiala viscosa]KAI1624156.1 hypothetical protein EDD37DRAFT_657801 [Exophiala viscosa]
MNRPPSRSRAPMSLEDSLDEENREVLAALDSKGSPSPMARITHARTATPPPPSHSRLYVDAPTPRHGSIAGIGVGITSPTQSRTSGALDPSDPSTYTSPHSSKSTSPVLTKAQPLTTRQRAASEADRLARPSTTEVSNKPGFEQKAPSNTPSIYAPSSAGTSSRLQMENKRPRQGSSPAMAAAMTGDFSKLYVGLPGAKPLKDTGAARGHSRSPSSRSRKSDTSQPALLSPRKSAGPLLSSGTNVDNQTSRRLSNKSGSFSTFTDDSEEGAGRIHADEIGEEDALAESSDEDAGYSSSDDDETRGRSDRRKYSQGEAAENKPAETTITSSPPTQTPPTPSLPKEPSISITDPAGEVSAEKPEVHPPTNFARSQSVSSHEDEDDEVKAIRKAKSLALNMSPLDTTVPNRHVQILLRGNWVHFHQEAEAGHGHRQSRTYLVCSDLSTEATYAMEWVVGTMLRNGDTLLAIYAIEDESAGKPTEAEKEILHAEGAQAGKAASEAMDVLTRQTTQGGGTSVGLDSQNKYVPATEIMSLSGSVDARKMSKKDMERLKGVEAVTQTFIRLVRKTTLEVRCMIEVIHCKSPKHLLLGAIDELEPTLCVVGTRGRSSLKGVLLGSFSNYLVTKSSVPVMVARRRLKKPRSDVRISSHKIRLTNNLTASHVPVKRRSLTQARID